MHYFLYSGNNYRGFFERIIIAHHPYLPTGPNWVAMHQDRTLLPMDLPMSRDECNMTHRRGNYNLLDILVAMYQ
jgi:hypothetical protein